MRVLGVVAQLHRHPVKSMVGEDLTTVTFDERGVPFDRTWGVRDSETGAVLTGRVHRRLLHCRSRLAGDGDGDGVVVTLPDGRTFSEDDDALDLALSHLVERPVHLARAERDEESTFEAPGDPLDDRSEHVRWPAQPGTFNDGHSTHLLTTASLRSAHELQPSSTWDPRRFRPNVVIDADGDGFPEESWTTIRIGTAVLEVYKRTSRCAIAARSQPDLLDDLDVPRTLARHRDRKLGVYARVITPGSASVGDEVVAVDA